MNTCLVTSCNDWKFFAVPYIQVLVLIIIYRYQAYFSPVNGLMQTGEVVPKGLPKIAAQMTRYLFVSIPLPGPTVAVSYC